MSSGAGSPTASLPSPSRPAANSSPNGTGTLSYPEQVVRLVNKEREKAGLQPLAISQPAEAAALVRAKETEQSFSHTRPNGSSFSTALTEAGVSYARPGPTAANSPPRYWNRGPAFAPPEKTSPGGSGRRSR